MRHSDQLPLSAPWIGHVHAAELAAISALLDQQPRIMALVEQDLRTRCPKNPATGRRGLTGDQVLRMALARQMNGWSYEPLVFHVPTRQAIGRFAAWARSRQCPRGRPSRRTVARCGRRRHPGAPLPTAPRGASGRLQRLSHACQAREAATLGDPAHSASGDRQATHGRSRSHHARPSDGGLRDVRSCIWTRWADPRPRPSSGSSSTALSTRSTRDLHGSGPHLDDYETHDDRLLSRVGFSVEPGVYLAGEFGVRSELNMFWGERGSEVTLKEPQREMRSGRRLVGDEAMSYGLWVLRHRASASTDHSP